MRIGLVDRLVFVSPDDNVGTKAEKLNAEALTEVKQWIMAPGREGTKELLRKKDLLKLQVNENREYDLFQFIKQVEDPIDRVHIIKAFCMIFNSFEMTL